MPVKLSNGKTLNETGSRDPRGYPILKDSVGNIYTQRPDGAIVLSSSSGLTETNNPLVNTVASDTARNILAVQNPQAYDIPSLSDFREKSEDEIGEYYDKTLELLAKQITVARRQATEKRDLGIKRSDEDEASYFQNEDVIFSQYLDAAQSGFAGRNTFTSGFRNKSIGQAIEQREGDLTEAERKFLRGEEDIANAYNVFDENLSLEEETKKLEINRNKESAIIQRQRQLAAEENQRRAAERATQEEAQADFVRQRLA